MDLPCRLRSSVSTAATVWIAIQAKAIPQDFPEDALHVAVAVVNGTEYLLTWNYKHLANAGMRSKIEATCRELGYEAVVICTPEELMEV
jgi:hypothetical protein